MMHDEGIHVPDQELLLLADGELDPSREAQVRAHLKACWTCRARVAEIESTIAEFVRVHHAGLDSQLPASAGPRALLRSHLAELARSSRKRTLWERLPSAFSGSGLTYAFAVLAIVAVGASIGRYGGGPDRWSALSTQFRSGPTPNKSLTPGATRPVSQSDICASGYRDMNRVVPTSLREEVFRKYGIAASRAEDYEVDYLITPELGGSDDIRNLWPEPYLSTEWNAFVKDALEDRLHAMVCEGRIDLPTAQNEMASNWISAYKKYFHTDRPLAINSENPPEERQETRNRDQGHKST